MYVAFLYNLNYGFPNYLGNPLLCVPLLGNIFTIFKPVQDGLKYSLLKQPFHYIGIFGLISTVDSWHRQDPIRIPDLGYEYPPYVMCTFIPSAFVRLFIQPEAAYLYYLQLSLLVLFEFELAFELSLILFNRSNLL